MKKKNIAVVLGDPRLSDPVKKNGKFNPEDIKVIEILRSALKLLNYDFICLDNHATLLKDLENLSQ